MEPVNGKEEFPRDRVEARGMALLRAKDWCALIKWAADRAKKQTGEPATSGEVDPEALDMLQRRDLPGLVRWRRFCIRP